MADYVLSETRGRTRILTINRPEVKNVIDNNVADAMLDKLEEIDRDDSVAAGVIAGAGNVFCAGMDLKAFASQGVPRKLHDIYRRRSVKPLVAAIEEYAFGGGLELALSCDILVAAKSAKLAIPEVTVGMFAAGGGIIRLAHRLPYGIAMEMALSGQPILAEQAFEYGLVNRLAEPGRALEVALELVERISRNAPLSVRASKVLVQDSIYLTEEAYWERQKPYARELLRSNDAVEGARAFAERRDPVWTGT